MLGEMSGIWAQACSQTEADNTMGIIYGNNSTWVGNRQHA